MPRRPFNSDVECQLSEVTTNPCALRLLVFRRGWEGVVSELVGAANLHPCHVPWRRRSGSARPAPIKYGAQKIELVHLQHLHYGW